MRYVRQVQKVQYVQYIHQVQSGQLTSGHIKSSQVGIEQPQSKQTKQVHMSEGKQVRLRHTCSCTCFGVQHELRLTSSVGLAKLPSNVSRSTVGVVVISFVCVHRPLEGGLPDLQQQSDNKTSFPDLHLPDCILQRSVRTCSVAC